MKKTFYILIAALVCVAIICGYIVYLLFTLMNAVSDLESELDKEETKPSDDTIEVPFQEVHTNGQVKYETTEVP